MDLKDVIKVVEGHAEDISNINCKVANMEVNHARIDVQLQNLITTMDKLADSIKLVFFGALGITAGFVIWYIQQLG
jgi:hypothetical protein